MSNPTPDRIMQLATGCWPSKCILAGNDLGLFALLGSDQALTAESIREHLGLHPRGIYDWLDALVSFGVLERDGDGPVATYRNSEEAALFLDRNSPAAVSGFLSMFNARIYGMWGDLEDGLRTGEPQNEIKHTGKVIFEELYEDPAKLRQFMEAMKGLHYGPMRAFAEKFDFKPYQTMCDVGGALGVLAITVAEQHEHLQIQSFDLPPVEPLAAEEIAKAGLRERVTAVSGDFFKNPLPKVDLITMGQILHDWDLPNKQHLIKAAYDALPEGGAFVVMESLIDDARRENTFGLLLSLHMMMEFGGAFDYTHADFNGWCLEAGFKRTEAFHLAGPMSAAVAYK